MERQPLLMDGQETKALLVMLRTNVNDRVVYRVRLDELKSLVESLGIEVVGEVVQTRYRPFAKYHVGKGKVGANVWEMPICTGKERLRSDDGARTHSTQKPLELLRRVLRTSTDPGDLVLDPVAGTGTTAAAARELGRHFTLIERDEAYVKAAKARLGAASV